MGNSSFRYTDIADAARIAALPEEQQADAIKDPATVIKNAAGRKKPDGSSSQKAFANADPKCAINGTSADHSMEHSSSEEPTNEAADHRNPIISQSSASSIEAQDEVHDEGFTLSEAAFVEKIEHRRAYDESSVDRILENVRKDLAQLFLTERTVAEAEKERLGETISEKIILFDALMTLKSKQ